MSIREQLVSTLDYIPDAEVMLLLEIARRFTRDDVASPDDLAAIREAREEYARGESIPESAIDWD